MKTKNTPKPTVAKAAKNSPKVSTKKAPVTVSAPKTSTPSAPKVVEAKPTTPSFRAETMVGKLFSVLKDGNAHKPETLWSAYQSKSTYQILTDLRRAIKPFGWVVNRLETGSYQLEKGVHPATAGGVSANKK